MSAAALISRLGGLLEAIAQAAWDHEPDWDAVYEGADHNWCADASRDVVALLAGRGLAARAITGGLDGRHHTWVQLDDDTIIDATVEQYIDRTQDAHLDDRHVPWMTLTREAQPALTWPDEKPWEADVRVAVIPAAHPFHRRYHTT